MLEDLLEQQGHRDCLEILVLPARLDPPEIEALMELLALQELLGRRDQKVNKVILDQLAHKVCLVKLGQPEQLEILVRLVPLVYEDSLALKELLDQLDSRGVLEQLVCLVCRELRVVLASQDPPGQSALLVQLEILVLPVWWAQLVSRVCKV